jgi:hypothetical protein
LANKGLVVCDLLSKLQTDGDFLLEVAESINTITSKLTSMKLRFTMLGLLSTLFALSGLGLRAQTYEHNTGWHYYDTLMRGNNITKVWLWLPGTVTTGGGLRGLITASATVAEESFVLNQEVRTAATNSQLGILFFNPSAITAFGTGGASGIDADTTFFLRALDKMANASGFAAVRHCPWFTMGHSTGSAFARNLPWWKPERCLGALVFKGGAITAPSWSNKLIAEVPLLGMSGQFEEYGPNGGCSNPRDNDANYRATAEDIIRLRQNAPRQLGFATMLPGEGHFAFARPEGAQFVAMFIEKCAQYRLPLGVYADNGPVTLNAIDEQTGWVADTSVYATVALDSVPNTSNLENKFWFLDKQLAQAWQAIHIKAGNNIYNETRVLLAANGNTPNITGATGLNYNDCNGKSWVGNASIGDVITFNGPTVGSQTLITEDIAGAAVEDAPNTFTINPTLVPDNGSVWMRMWVDRDGSGNTAADRLVRLRPQRRTNGTSNFVTIVPIGDQQEGASFSPTITVSSGQTPFVTVVAGPATISNGVLTIGRIPAGRDTVKVVLRAAAAGNSTFASSAVTETSFRVYQAIVSQPKAANLSNLILLYPNPATTSVQIALSNQQDIDQVQVQDNTGRLIYTATVGMPKTSINTTRLTAGLYSVRIWSGNTTATKRFVVR